MRKRELWFTRPFEVELRQAPPPPLGAGQVRLRALFSGISQGTELLLYGGEGPTPFDPSLDAPGTATFPRRYGYAWVGEVVSPGCELPLGSRVFGLLPHGDEHCVDPTSVRLLPLEVPPVRAVLAANLETALNVVWDARIRLGDDVTVLGGGVVGLLSGHLAKRAGAGRLRLVEPSAARRRAAQALGFDQAFTPDEAPSRGDDDRSDVVIEATGNPACLDRAIALARDEGLIAVASFYGARTAPIALGAEFHRRRLTVRSSQVSRVSPERVGWSHARRFGLVMELLKNPRLDALLEAPVAFEQAPAVYEQLWRSGSERLQLSFDYGLTTSARH